MLVLLSTILRSAIFAPGRSDRFDRGPSAHGPTVHLEAATIASLVFGAVFVAGGLISLATMLIVVCLRSLGLTS